MSKRASHAPEEPDTPPKKKKKYIQRFKAEYSDAWPAVKPSSRGDIFAYCTVCHIDFSVQHGGRDDIRKHCTTKKHGDSLNASKSSNKITKYAAQTSDELKVIRAETSFTSFIVEHNLPVAASDHATTLFKKMFPDSKIASKYSCCRTKTSGIIQELASDTQTTITKALKVGMFLL